MYPFDLDIESESLQHEENGSVGAVPQTILTTTPNVTPSPLVPTSSSTTTDVPDATNEPGDQQQKKTSSKQGNASKKKQKKPTLEEGLVTVVEQGLDRQVPAYEALKQAGFIGHPAADVED